MRGSNRRRYFTAQELAKLISAARKGRHGQRDATLILLMARHGLRVSEAVDLEWDQIDFTRAHIHIRRLDIPRSKKLRATPAPPIKSGLPPTRSIC
jgi:integrase